MSTDLVSAVLRAYADLSSTSTTSKGLVVAPFGEVHTMSDPGTYDGSLKFLGPPPGSQIDLRAEIQADQSAVTERLAKLDALHVDELLIRHSWVLVVGTIEVDGTPTRVLQPLASRPVRIRPQTTLARAARLLIDEGATGPYVVERAGDAELTPMVEDADLRASLLEDIEFGSGAIKADTNEALIARMPKVVGWVRRTCTAAGLPVGRLLGPQEDPAEWIDRPGLVAVLTHSLHTARQVDLTSTRSSMSAWSHRPGIAQSAMGAMLLQAGETPPSDAGLDGVVVESPMLLTPSQRTVVLRARTQALTVVSGAPGSGKTHALCAVALDTVAAGGSVLIATQSRHAADVVTELLERTPGPSPVRFGDGAGMAELILELTERSTHPIDPAELRRLDEAVELARAEVDGLRTSIATDLELESEAQDADRWRHALPALIADAPRIFDLDSDLTAIAAAIPEVERATTDAQGRGWFTRWRARRARARLDRLTGAAPSTELARLSTAVRAARAGRAAATIESRGGIAIGERWDQLADADDRWRDALGRRQRVAPFEPSALDASARAALGQLVTALRAGRGRRRELLASMHPGHLTAVAPLWVGTLADIEDVLPATAGLFDLVILDEASQIEQPRAAPALLRAARAVVVGDPYQLRHVSFRSDADVDRTLTGHGLYRWRALLDLRRVSTFDLAAAAAPVDHLREHFRSVPHLIEFSIERFYRDRVEVMTRHPRNEVVDAIDVIVAPAPVRANHKVRSGEIDLVVSTVRQLADDGVTGIGVVSPFRDQADSLEAALMSEFDVREIRDLALRVGTVHSFQGGERDVVVASLALAETDDPGRRRFLEQPNLFNVMVTRARHRMIVVTSLPLSAPGLSGEYLRYAEKALPPIGRGEPKGPSDGSTRWRDALAEELAHFDTVRIDYPVGPWLLELCLGDGDTARLLECSVHADGVDAHIERHLTLMRLGWTIVDAYPSRWERNAARAALDLR